MRGLLVKEEKEALHKQNPKRKRREKTDAEGEDEGRRAEKALFAFLPLDSCRPFPLSSHTLCSLSFPVADKKTARNGGGDDEEGTDRAGKGEEGRV